MKLDRRSPLLVLLPGLGATATTLIAGVDLIRRSIERPVGSLTQLGTMPTRSGELPVREVLPLASLADLRFAAWDPFPDDGFAAARKAGVLTGEHQTLAAECLRALQPRSAVFDQRFVPALDGEHVKTGTLYDQALELRRDICEARSEARTSRAVMLYASSTEMTPPLAPCHEHPEAFVDGLKESNPAIAPSQVYGWAALMEGVPFVNCTPNRIVEIPALAALAEERHIPTAGKDLKTGQTLLKTVLAPMLSYRRLGVKGWFSVNALGNRDGQVLAHEGNRRSKEETKLGVLHGALHADATPELYGQIDHLVTINYFPTRGDSKEAWDVIDLFGWLSYPMSLRIHFECKDSILAAPLMLDLVLLLDFAARAGSTGPQPWLGAFFKCPLLRAGDQSVQDFFEQYVLLRAELSRLSEATDLWASEPQ